AASPCHLGSTHRGVRTPVDLHDDQESCAILRYRRLDAHSALYRNLATRSICDGSSGCAHSDETIWSRRHGAHGLSVCRRAVNGTRERAAMRTYLDSPQEISPPLIIVTLWRCDDLRDGPGGARLDPELDPILG